MSRRADRAGILRLMLVVGAVLAPWVRGQDVPAEVQTALAAAPTAMGSITAADLKGHLTKLASDEFEGRLTGTPGQLMAARYVADAFAKAGLAPLGAERAKTAEEPSVAVGRDWFHTYPLELIELSADAGLLRGDELIVAGGTWFGLKDVNLEGPLRFLGRELPNARDPIDLEGSIPVLALSLEGSEVRNLMGDLLRAATQFRSVARRLARANATAGILIVDRFTPAAAGALNMAGIFVGKPGVTNPAEAFDQMAMLGNSAAPLMIVTGKDGARILESLGTSFEAVFGKDAKPEALASKVPFTLRAQRRQSPAKGVNVVGYLRGRDPELADEAVVFSAHMDHVGMGPDGQPYNGADDNGSGTSTLLEFAQAFGSLTGDERPRRSVIFLSVSGEELGLWGSEAYAQNPTWPLENIVANVNIDMIGRSTDKVPAGVISLTPSHRHKEFSTLARDAAWLGQGFGLSMTSGDRFYERSDHYNFARRGVPVMFFCDDEHPDYHMQTDDVEKIEFDKMERIARLAFLVGYRTANADARPETLGKKPEWFTP